MKKAYRVLLPLLFWTGVWQLAAAAVGKELLLPAPLAVGRRLLELCGTGAFWLTAGASLGRILLGLLAGVVLGTLLAGLTSALPWADCLLSPAVKVIRATPVASFILLVYLWVERGRVPGLISALMVLPVVWGNVTRGIVATGDQFISGGEQAAKIRGDFGADACEMEGGSIGQVCALNKIPFAVIRAISDHGDDEASVDFPAFASQAAQKSIELLKTALPLL